VSDIALPNENDGYALIQQLRTSSAERGELVIAIAVTGYANEKMLEYAGFDLWFTKPLDFDEFLAVLGCLAIYQQCSYASAQQILGHVPRHRELSLEKQ
jgi:two-component system, OmpR family, response regulator